MIDIIRYREAAITYLKSRAASLYFEVDDLLDKALRLTSDLPLRPSLDDTYNNIIGIKPVVEQRLICLKLLLERLNKNSFDSNSVSDYLIDDSVRLLNSLPKRPSNNLPYVALFNLEERKVNSSKDYNLPSFYKTNEKGIQLMHSFEGLVLKAYKDPGSTDSLPITIGYGTTRINGKPVKLGTVITKEQADKYFRDDLIQFEDAVKKYVKVPITENMFSSLTSLIYNIGTGNFLQSTVLKKLNQKKYEEAADAFLKWVKGSNNNVLLGLVKRREAEAKLFLS